MMHCHHLLRLKHKKESDDSCCHRLLHCNRTIEKNDGLVLSSSSS
jgi:hypothetical protein